MIGYIKTVGKGKETIKIWLTDFWPMKTVARKHQKTKGTLARNGLSQNFYLINSILKKEHRQITDLYKGILIGRCGGLRKI